MSGLVINTKDLASSTELSSTPLSSGPSSPLSSGYSSPDEAGPSPATTLKVNQLAKPVQQPAAAPKVVNAPASMYKDGPKIDGVDRWRYVKNTGVLRW